MNKILKNGCNLVNYRTYNNIKNTMLLSGTFVGLSNLFISFMVNPNSYLGYVSTLFYLAYAYMDYSNGENYTRDYNELRNLYNEFISNYNKMNKDFSNNSPISIYTMFNFLVDKGYLSKDREFNKYNDDCYDLDGLIGTDVICGKGVCRHISSMLTDILNDYGISSMNTVCYMPQYDYQVLPTNKENYSKDKNLSVINKYVNSMEEREKIIDKLDFLAENEIYLSVDYVPDKLNDRKLKRYGNHLITYSLYDDKSYYLDPTLSKIYRLKDFKKGILYDNINMDIFIKKSQFHRFNDLSGKELDKFVKYMRCYQDSISMDVEDDIINFTNNICVSNMDIFDKFYHDNYELYKEIENKLIKIKGRKK